MVDSATDVRSRIWMVLTFGDDRQHAGNTGYDDAPDSWYSYDSFVGNHKQISIGDCLLVCDRDRALGVARIHRIDAEPSSRVLQRCPECKGTGIKKRLSKQPLYRCKNGHEFDEALVEDASCTKYTAHFSETFQPFTETFGRDFLRQGCPRYSDQNAMQEFDFSLIEDAFRSTFPGAADLIANFVFFSYLVATNGETDSGRSRTGYKLTENDERERLLRQILARRGQQAFRQSLRMRYGDACVISGCKIVDVLEAAHIQAYRNEQDNHEENGLLLRADLHTLFDLDLLGIEPVDLVVHLHPTINQGDYQTLHGCRLLCNERNRPSLEALSLRWQAFGKRLHVS